MNYRLIAILALAAAVRLYRIDSQSLWLDEFHNLSKSACKYQDRLQLPDQEYRTRNVDLLSLQDAPPWTQIWTSLGEDTHPPLYLILLRWWRELCGDNDSAPRIFSALASLGAVLLIYDVAQLISGRSAALCAALLLAVWPLHVEYARQIEPYALLTFLALAAASALLRIEAFGPSRGRCYTLLFTATALVFIHYFSVGFLIALTLYAVLRLRNFPRRAAVSTLAAAAVIFLGTWGLRAWNQQPAIDYYSRIFAHDSAPAVLWRLLLLPARMILNISIIYDTPISAWYALVALIYVVPLPFVRKYPKLLLPYLWFLGVILSIAAVDIAAHTKLLTFSRYTLLAVPPFALLICGMCSRRIMLTLAIAALGLFVLPDVFAPHGWNPRLLAHLISANAHDGDILVFKQAPGDASWRAAAIYPQLVHYLAPPTIPVVFLRSGESPSPQVMARLKQAPGLWLVCYDALEPGDLVPGCRPMGALRAPGVADVYLAVLGDGRREIHGIGREQGVYP